MVSNRNLFPLVVSLGGSIFSHPTLKSDVIEIHQAIILEDKFLPTSFCKKVAVMAGHDGFSIAEVRWLGPYQAVSSGLRSSPHSARRDRLTGTLACRLKYCCAYFVSSQFSNCYFISETPRVMKFS